MPTPNELIGAAGFVVLVSAAMALLLAMTFCNRSAPRWVRAGRDVALVLIGARWLTRQHLDWEPYWFAAIALHLAVWCAVIAAWNVRAALVLGDRCRDRA